MEMVEVSKDTFFKRINPLNVGPRSLPDRSLWRMLDGSERVIGKSEPGYKSPYPTQLRYWLAK